MNTFFIVGERAGIETLSCLGYALKYKGNYLFILPFDSAFLATWGFWASFFGVSWTGAGAPESFGL